MEEVINFGGINPASSISELVNLYKNISIGSKLVVYQS